MWRGSHEKGLRGVGCVQVMCEIGRFGGWWMDVLELEGCVVKMGAGGRELENLIRDAGSVVSYTPRAWVELA